MNPSRIQLATYAASISLFVLLFELLSFVTFKYGIIEQGVFRGVIAVSKEEFGEYLEERDDDLGWPTKAALTQRHEGNGFRKSPELKLISNDKPPCLAVYGDSFAFGDEVSDTEAWPNQLARILGCKVLNYGVPAYGTDQALMRFEKLHSGKYPALMTFIDGDLGRNRNQVRGIWDGQINVRQSKPRFLARDESINTPSGLEKIALPINRYEELGSLMGGESLGNILEHEAYLPDSSIESSITPSFPYSISILKFARNKLITGISSFRNIAGKQDILTRFRLGLKEFTPPQIFMSKASISLQGLILERFLHDCNERGIRCGILRLPKLKEVQFDYENPHIISELKESKLIREHIVELNMDCFDGEFAARDVSKTEIIRQKMPSGHYNPIANQVMAACISKAEDLPVFSD
jgi:hypothetical protein